MPVKLADCRDEWTGAFRLVYEAYTRTGLAESNPCHMRVTPYQLLPTTEVLVAIDQNRVVCTASVVRDGMLGLPLEDVYAEEVASRRRQGLVLAEISCLADSQEGERPAFSIVLQLISLSIQCAKARGVGEVLIAVHPRHAPFHQRFLGFERIGEERSYDAVLGAPAVALALNLNHLADHHPSGYERLFGTPFPADTLAYRPMPDHLRLELASNMPDMAASNECLRENQRQAGGPVVCASCRNRGMCSQLVGPLSPDRARVVWTDDISGLRIIQWADGKFERD